MNLRPLLILPPIALAVLGFMQMTKSPEQVQPDKPETRLAVRFVPVEARPLVVTAKGYGRVEPVHEWTAVTEVQGRIKWMHEGLAVGSIVEEGTPLFEIDAANYILARDKARANIASVEAQLAELDRQEANSRISLDVNERILAVSQAEHDRILELMNRGTATQAQLDTARKTLLAQTSTTTNTRNTLALYPSKRKSLEASLQARKLELADATLSVERTRMVAPFRGRVSALFVETGQFVRGADKVLVLQDVSAAEITAELQPSGFAPMVGLALADELDPGAVIDTTKAVAILKEAGITAEVALVQSGLRASWPAEIERMRGTMDSETGSLGLIVRVKDPLMGNRLPARPPLNVGMFVEVTFSTRPIDGVLTIARLAVHYDDKGQPFAYVANPDDRLTIAPLTLGPIVGDAVVVEAGLAEGMRLLLTNPQPPVPGMALDLIAETGDK